MFTGEILLYLQSCLYVFLPFLTICINFKRKKSLQMESQTSFRVMNDQMKPFNNVTVILDKTSFV